MDMRNAALAPVEIDYDPAAALVTLRYQGHVDADGLSRAHEAMVTVLAGRPADGVLIDARRSQPGYSQAELMDSLDVCLTDTAPQRCAVIAPPARESLVKLLESGAFPHGVRVRAFADVEDARRWVLSA